MIRLYINYKEIEIQQDTNNVLANFSINDISGVGQRRGAVTQTIELPATAANQSALLTLSATGAPAYIESNGVSVFSGRARVSEIKRNISGVVSILVTLYGDNLDFAYLLSDRQVRDVVTENFTHDVATVSGGVSGKVVFPLVNYGDLDTANEIKITEMRPAINVAYILEKILNGIGYKLSSNFFAGDGLNFWQLFTCGEYVPAADYLHNQSFRASLAGRQSGTYSIGGFARLQFDDDSTPPNYDPSNLWDTTLFESIVPKTGFYTTTIVVETTNTDRPTYLMIQDTMGNPIVSPDLVSDDGTFVTFNMTLLWQETDNVITFPYEFFIYSATGAGNAFDFEAGSYIEIVRTSSGGVREGDEVNISDCLPLDTTQLNYIKGLTHLFNLYFYADVNRKIFYCEPRNNFVGTSGLNSGFYDTTVIDINELVNVGSETTVKIYDNLGEVVRFQHNEGDNYVGQIEAATNEILYSATWGMETQSKNNVTVSENPVFGRFSLMSSSSYANTGNVVLPRLFNADWDGSSAYPAKSYEFAPMIAIIESGVQLPNGWKMTYGGGSATYTAYNYAFMFDFVKLSSIALSLSFGNEINILGNETAGLLQRFYLREQVSKRGGQVMELKMVVSAWLINYLHSIRYKAFFQYGGDLYAIQEIKNYVVGSTEICSVSLLLERFADAADVALIENSDLNCFNNV